VTLSGKSDPEILEVLECRKALALANDIGARAVRVASDCMAAVRMIQEGTLGTYAQVVKEIKDTRSNFEELGFCHEGRRSNGEAQRLARISILVDSGRHVWFVTPPLKGLCPRGNNKVVIIIFHVYDKCLFLMLELY
jgi:hypothetical protein